MRNLLQDQRLQQLRLIEKNIREFEAAAPGDTSARGGILRALREKRRDLRGELGAVARPRPAA